MEIIYSHMTIFNIIIKDIGSLYPSIVYIWIFWREKEQIEVTFEKLR